MSVIKPVRIVVIVSGSGTNLQKLIEAIEAKEYITINAVISDRPAYALERAKQYNIANYLCSKKAYKAQHFFDIDQICQDVKADIIVLSGFLGILPRWFTLLWSNKIINIHPALLPKFGGKGMYGMNVHEAVINAGEKESGCTIHWVIPEIDKGQIIAQASVVISADDTAKSLQQKVVELEHKLYPQTIINLAKKIYEKRS